MNDVTTKLKPEWRRTLEFLIEKEELPRAAISALELCFRELDKRSPPDAPRSAMDVVGWLGSRGHETVVDEKARAKADAPTAWIDCGECDPEFACHDGQTRCIRLSPAPPTGDE
jgi:hypothetical protein